MTESTSRPGGRTARNTAAVLDATILELGARGYEQLSMEAVAQRAQVHKTTVYRRWENKERLVVDALEAGAGDLVLLAHAIRRTLRSPEGGAIVRALVAGGAESAAVRGVARRFWSTRMRALRPVVERAVGRGEFPAGTDADAVLMAVAAPLYFRLL